MLLINPTLAAVKESATLAINIKAKAMRDEGRDMTHFGFGEYQKHAGYNFSAARIAVGPGSKELIYHLLYILEGPVILPAPSLVSYASQATLHGRAVHFVRTKRQDGYRMKAEDLAAALAKIHTPQKILILNSPGNPTGQVYNHEELKAIAAVCCEHNVIVISDEIYAQTDFIAPMSPGLAAYCPQQVFITAGLS